jgi:protein ImuB
LRCGYERSKINGKAPVGSRKRFAVARLACVEVPAFQLQVLLKQHPEWRNLPVAVLDAERAQGCVLWANEQARNGGVRPGQRYSQAIAHTAELRTGTVPRDAVAPELARLTEVLRRFSPDVEPYTEQPGVFWLSGAGLGNVFASASVWAQALATALSETEFQAQIVVGFSRFNTYAIARALRASQAQNPMQSRKSPSSVQRNLKIFRSQVAEQQASHLLPLAQLEIPLDLYEWATQLGITTLGEYLELPASGILLRFGRAALQLHELAQGVAWDPLRPEPVVEPLHETFCFDEPEADASRLLFAFKSALDGLMARVAARHQALFELEIELRLERAAPQIERLRPAEATLEARVLLRLLQLRLEASPPCAAVLEVCLRASSTPARAEQLALFFEKPRRNLQAANQVLAELRAELGNHAVQRAVLCDGHLPEAQFRWQPLDRLVRPTLATAQEPSDALPTLVRRFFPRPRALSAPLAPGFFSSFESRWQASGREALAQWLDPWANRKAPLAASTTRASLTPAPTTGGQGQSTCRLHGPFLVSGGWWNEKRSSSTEVAREYAFVELEWGSSEELLSAVPGLCWWIYFDRRRNRWFVQGAVE